jgi:ATP-dependent Clp protease ATP-binding subunit ClpC
MTTNLGSKDISKGALGFNLEGNQQNDFERMAAKVNEELKKSFKPEFLNRVDDVIVFPQLSKPELLEIVDLFIKKLNVRLEERDITLTLTVAAKERLIELGYDPAMGARPLRRAVQREIEDKISESILQGVVKNASDVTTDVVAGEFIFTSNVRVVASI